MKNWLVTINFTPMGAVRGMNTEAHYFSDGVQAWEFFYDTVRDVKSIQKKGTSIIQIAKDASDGFNKEWMVHGSEVLTY